MHWHCHFSSWILFKSLCFKYKECNQENNRKAQRTWSGYFCCNSMNASGIDNNKQIKHFVVQFLNCTKKHFEKWKIEQIAAVGLIQQQFTKTCFEKCKLIVPIQPDQWLCGYRSLLARQNFVDLLLIDVIWHHKISLKSKIKK